MRRWYASYRFERYDGWPQVTACIPGPDKINGQGPWQTLAWRSPGLSDTGELASQARISSADAHAGTSSASASMTIDGTEPTVTANIKSFYRPDEAVSAQVTDAGSGLDRTFYAADSTAPAPKTVVDPDCPSDWKQSMSPALVTQAPPGGRWDLGPHKLRVASFDKAGNRTVKELSFNVTMGRVVPKQAPTRTWKRCGSRGRFLGLRTIGGTSRRYATQIARRVRWKRAAGRSIGGYYCRSSSTLIITCTRGARIVRWRYR